MSGILRQLNHRPESPPYQRPVNLILHYDYARSMPVRGAGKFQVIMYSISRLVRQDMTASGWFWTTTELHRCFRFASLGRLDSSVHQNGLFQGRIMLEEAAEQSDRMVHIVCTPSLTAAVHRELWIAEIKGASPKVS